MKKTPISYDRLFERNIGLVTEAEQEILRTSTVLVLGEGGIGGMVTELLARSGIGRFRVVDHDEFEASNVNRQIFAFMDTVGLSKTETARKFIHQINPNASVETYATVTEENAEEVVGGANAVVLGIDKVAPCIAAMRAAHTYGVPAVEGWAIPYGNVRVIDSETSSLEELYHLPTLGRSLAGVSEKELAMLDMCVLESLGRIPGVLEYYPPEVREGMMSGTLSLRSFCPMVWLTSTMMATEVIKLLLGWGVSARAPEWFLFDPYEFRSFKYGGEEGLQPQEESYANLEEMSCAV